MSDGAIGTSGVLVVDDEMGAREALRFILKGDAFPTVYFATNGKEALDCVERLGPELHLILLDMRMPVMDGMTFLGRLAERQPPYAVGVIATTGLPSEDGRRKFFDAATATVRLIDYIAKPYDIGEVRSVVNSALGAVQRLRTAGHAKP